MFATAIHKRYSILLVIERKSTEEDAVAVLFWLSWRKWRNFLQVLRRRNREYFTERAGVRYLRTSCWRIRNRTSERSEISDTKSSRNVCKAALQAVSAYKRREFWRETHTPLWLLIGRIIFFTCENHRSLLWLARTSLRTKIYDIAFWWVFLSMYIINFFPQPEPPV